MVAWAAILLGFGLGGLLDGILFHQVLQWHHLAAAMGGDLRQQVRLDGLFNLAMAGLLGLGMVLLWSGRAEWPDASPPAFWGTALAGFGGFQLIDGLLFHWGLGLHHVNMLSPVAVVVWDGVMFALGLVLTTAGLALVAAARRRKLSRSVS